jgi:hypothetical protein
MKLQSIELPLGKNQSLQKSPKIVLLVIFTLVFLTVVPYYPLTRYPPYLHDLNDASKPPSSSSSSSYGSKDDIFSGEWIPNLHAQNTTCWAIHEHQNCMKYGRSDSDFMKWRWKPSGCDLPVFNPAQFLELVRGKSLAFVRDSVGRNQMQSLICLLSRVSPPLASIFC